MTGDAGKCHEKSFPESTVSAGEICIDDWEDFEI